MMAYKEYLRLLNIDESMLLQLPRFELLSRIILNHQLAIPFDTVRKFQDYNAKKTVKENYADVNKYIESVRENGYGGTCFHLTWGLYNLLRALHYDVQIIKLEELHFALVVSYDAEEYYVDVGFWAPLFKPFPLRENWIVTNHVHSVEWRYVPETQSGTLLCGGEPAKWWDGRFLTVNDFWCEWENSMHEDNTFLQNLYINKWKNPETFLFLVNNSYKEFYKGEKIQDIQFDYTNSVELKNLLVSNFKVDGNDYIYLLDQHNKSKMR
ncbi:MULTISPECIES: arylamine N-acetyltransferase [unclassified Lysinibacillus]|uniref:arylamine N-acetyltransferase n=2 Tax=Bacillati TaxID=1783272 RepID=UPI001170EA8B|nr:arylamine N-acetyltransferase [Lysinibacillus sp. CD3-6]QPQ37134.1 arylamine N-acetyltransferase [Lysinibacillus sp. JNUCC-52]UED81135.1 arylamine N-acetyltransferase [Lysinibacillus sp. CD3-6]